MASCATFVYDKYFKFVSMGLEKTMLKSDSLFLELVAI